MSDKLRLGVLGSGRGSNFVAIAKNIKDGELDAVIAVVVSDKPSVMLEKAREFGFETLYLNPKTYSNRLEYDHALITVLKDFQVDLVILAGYMRILSVEFIRAFEGRILNIHPSLLPAFKGLHPQRQALEAGMRESGCTVHLVTEDLDSGPILTQARVPILEGDTEEKLAARILEKEHVLYTEAIKIWMKKNGFQ